MQWVIFGGITLVAILLAYLILRVILGFISSIPKWIYVLVILGVIAAAAFAVFETAVFDAFSTYQ